LSIENQISNDGIAVDKLIKIKKAPRHQLAAKWMIDKLVSLGVLICLSPLLIFTALLIKLDSKGPVIFRQKRNGLNNSEFLVWKFRTMTVMEDGADVEQAQINDVRITRIGNFLRKTSIDEIPQFINVLIGDMSIVGPRPHPVALNDKFRPLIEEFDNRNGMKPGLTGLAQIKGYRGPTNTTEQMRLRVEADIEYINTWSLWLDLKIMISTPYYGLITKNAF